MDFFSDEFKFVLSIVAVAMTLGMNGYYCVQNMRIPGKRPHVVTSALLGALTGMAGIAQLQAGAGFAATVSILTALFNVANAVTGWRKGGKKDITLNAKLCTALAALAAVFWLISGDPLIASILLTVAGILAYGPTLEKIRREPQSEFPNRFLLNSLRYFLATAAVTNYSWATLLYPAAWTIMNAMVYVYIRFELKEELKRKLEAIDDLCERLGIFKYLAGRPDLALREAPSDSAYDRELMNAVFVRAQAAIELSSFERGADRTHAEAGYWDLYVPLSLDESAAVQRYHGDASARLPDGWEATWALSGPYIHCNTPQLALRRTSDSDFVFA